jgi:hypothetical protein
VGPGRSGRRGHSAQAYAVRTLSAAVVGRGALTRAASGHRDPTRATGDHGVSVASGGLPGMWRSDPGGMARGHSHGRVRSAGAGDHSAVHGGVSSLQTHHSDRAGRPLWRLDQPGHGREPGAGDS